MTVKTIFKALIGTILVIVCFSLIVELLNISTTSLQLNQITKMSARQACILFSQETYKQRVGDISGGSVNMDSVKDATGADYIDGTFYPSDDAETIYQFIYSKPDFLDWVENSEAAKKGNWKSLNLINRAVNDPSSLNVPYPVRTPDMSQEQFDALLEDYTEAKLAKAYRDVMMTPLNMGVPYLDLDIVNRMFKWNTAQLVSSCNSNNIRTDDYGNTYVMFKGFRVYADQAHITNLEYRTFDLEDANDRVEFNRYTHIDPDNLGFEFNEELLGTATDERKRVCLVGVQYGVPVAYDGITPIKRLFNYVWDTEVQGLNDNSGRTVHEQWNDSLSALESGGFEGNESVVDVLPVPGKLIYYIIR